MSSKLEGRDFTIAVDRSGSMSMGNGSMSRWDSAAEGAVALARAASKFDPDGLTLLLFASSTKKFEDVSPDRIGEIFKEYEPMGSTDLAGCLSVFFADYFERKTTGKAKEKGEIGIFITDGAPNDPSACYKIIIEATKQLTDPEELGLTFIQVGDDDGATKFLTYLDDDLEKMGAAHDIVDTIKIADCEDKPLTQVLLDAIED